MGKLGKFFALPLVWSKLDGNVFVHDAKQELGQELGCHPGNADEDMWGSLVLPWPKYVRHQQGLYMKQPGHIVN